MSEKKQIKEASQRICTAAQKTTSNKFSDGRVEAEIQVDRKRLESMITGKPLYGYGKLLSPAEDFFQKVNELSGAVISWPTNLKIGAKTKKDPFVKMLGSVEQVDYARHLISSTLKTKSDEISLRMEIPPRDHSQIIGRKGKNTQAIIRDTMCNIHFPDARRNHDIGTHKEVLISGRIQQVEKTRERLRKLSPLCIICQLPKTCRYSFEEVQRSIAHSEISVSMYEEQNGEMKCILDGTEQNEVEMIKTVMILATLYQLHDDHSVLCHTVVSTTYSLQSLLLDQFRKDGIQWLARHTSTRIVESYTMTDGFELFVAGPIAGILVARKYINSLSPVAMHFERIVASEHDLIDKTMIESNFGVTVHEQFNTKYREIVILKSIEMNIRQLYQARERILDLVQNTNYATPVEFEYFRNGRIRPLIKNMRLEAQKLLGMYISVYSCASSLKAGTKEQSLYVVPQNLQQRSSSFTNFEGHSGLAEALVDVPERDANRYDQTAPNLDNSPIVHSLLTKANQIVTQNGSEQLVTRNQSQLNANHVVYNGSPTKMPQSTDRWTGYGFSNSLWTDVKRDSSVVKNITSNQYDRRSSTRQETKLLDSATCRSVSPSVVLGCVLEVDEYGTDIRNSSSSNSLIGSLSSRDSQLFQPYHLRGFTNVRTGRAGINSLSLTGNDIVWDIRVFVDPAMVLAQLKCNEYIAEFRKQEIDMEAFLLLDEQNLEDIGVTTMGARKKIYNAILRLRDSARMYGMRI